jgi:AraC-like DNA-binding protein
MDVLSDVISVSRLGTPHSARVRRHPPFMRRLPPSDAAGFHVVLQGSCWAVAPGHEPALLGPGDIVFFPRGSAHALMDSLTTVSFDARQEPLTNTLVEEQVESHRNGKGDNASASCVVMLCGAYLLERSRLHPLLEELPEMLHLPAKAGAQWDLRSAVELLGAEVDRNRPGADTAVSVLLDLMLLYILRTWLASGAHASNEAGWSAALKDPRVATALAGIHGEPAKPWTVETLANAAGLSRAAFSRRFSSLLGRSPAAYLTFWRMTVAARLLRSSDLPLATIAAEVGYASEYAFSHAFKRLYGISPGAYRRSSSRGTACHNRRSLE